MAILVRTRGWLRNKKEYFLTGFFLSLIVVSILAIIETFYPNWPSCEDCGPTIISTILIILILLSFIFLFLYLLFSEKSRLNKWLIGITLIVFMTLAVVLYLSYENILPLNSGGDSFPATPMELPTSN
jgi:uncharacterized membrane protein YozB (DUF420 family)